MVRLIAAVAGYALVPSSLTGCALSLCAVAGCAGVSPVAVSVPAAAGSLDCALAEATGRGYSVVAAEAGVFFRAERPQNALAFSVLNASAARGTLTVTASTEVRSEDGRRPQSPSGGASEDAEAVARACGA